MTLEERRRLLMQAEDELVEGVGIDGLAVTLGIVPGAVTTSPLSASVDYGVNFTCSFGNEAQISSTGYGNFTSSMKGSSGKYIVPNFVFDSGSGTARPSKNVFIFSGPSGSVAQFKDCLMVSTLNISGSTGAGRQPGTIIPRQLIHIGQVASNVGPTGVAVSPDLKKSMVVFNTCSIVSNLYTASVDAFARYITSKVSSYTASNNTKVNFTFLGNGGLTLREPATSTIKLVTSIDNNLTYAIAGSPERSASYSINGGTSWSDLIAAMSNVSGSGPTNKQKFMDAVISYDGKDSIIATQDGLFFSDNYLSTLSYKSYSDLGVIAVASGSRYHISLGASSKLRTVYLKTYTSTNSCSVYVSKNFGKNFTNKFNCREYVPVGGTVQSGEGIDCSADGKYAVIICGISGSGTTRLKEFHTTTDAGKTWTHRTLSISNNYSSHDASSRVVRFYKEFPGLPSHSL